MKTVGDQIIDMEKVFSNWRCERVSRRRAIWYGKLQPHSQQYTVRIDYEEPLLPEGRRPIYLQPLVDVVSAPLRCRFDINGGSLPHVYYSHPRAQCGGPFLCLFDDTANEWTPEDLLSNTTIPWASNWLSCYESWLVTGKWFGTGKHVPAAPQARSATDILIGQYYATTSNSALSGNFRH